MAGAFKGISCTYPDLIGQSLRMPFVSQLEPDALVREFIAHPPTGFTAQALPSGIPAFDTDFNILTTVEPEMRRRMDHWPGFAHWQHWLRLRTCFIGSTVAEYAWLPRGANPADFADHLLATQSRRCPLLIIKDIAHASPLLDGADNMWVDSFVARCEKAGCVMVEGQALAWVPIDFDDIDEYLSRLSRSRRRNIRRKLRSRAALEIEQIATGAAFSDDLVIDAFHALYCNVYAQSELHFDFLDREFFAAVLRDAHSGGIVFVYRHGGRMIGWNLCFEHGGALVDKFMGLVYPDARDHDLYAVSWMENLEYARSRGLRRYIAGWTDPEVKAQLGAQFTFTRHAVYPRNPMLRFALRKLARYFERDRAWREEAHATADP